MKLRIELLLAVLALAVLLCLPGTAGAEMKTVALSYWVCISPGETRMPVYKDYSDVIGEGLTRDDFNVTYKAKSKELTVTPEGRISVAEDIALGAYYVNATYTPKVPGVGEKRTFNYTVVVTKPLTKVTASADAFYMPVGSSRFLRLYLTGATDSTVISSATYDDDIVEVRRSSTQAQGHSNLYFDAVAPGETYVTLTSYNGIVKTFFIAVLEEMNKFEFASDHFYCYTGDTVDLGIDLGNGEYGQYAYSLENCNVTRNGMYYPYYSTKEYGYGSFHADSPGEYRITMTVGGLKATTMVTVYDRANCATIEVADGDIYVGQSGRSIVLRDAQGNIVSRPMEITEGEDIVSLEYSTLTATGTGRFTITAYNDDGTTVSRIFEVKEKPTIMTIDPAEVTLEIGEEYLLEPIFDTGSFNCTYSVDYDEWYPQYELKCIRMEGNRIIAQAAGTATVTATYGALSATCKVTVLDGEQAIHITLPEGIFGTGDTFQLEVKDKTGKVYPATFGTSWAFVDVKPEGLMTGVKAGTYTVHAKLEDGRFLYSDEGTVVSKPSWLSHDDVVTTVTAGPISFGTVNSDVGTIDETELEVTVEDESVVTYTGGRFNIVGVGVTAVTLKSIYNETTTSFIIDVMEEETLYVGSTDIKVPYGFMVALPIVTDSDGDEVAITWNITYDEPGAGNPEDSGYVLEADAIGCIWPTATCIVTGTAKSGATVKVFVSGYVLPEEITLDKTNVTIDKGQGVTLNVSYEEAGCEIQTVYWIAETEGIVSYTEVTNRTSNTFVGQVAGTTRVAAMLDNGVFAICEIIVNDPYARKPGDANEDGVIDAYDALLIMQYDAGWPVSINGYAGDVNADGQTNLADAVRIFQYNAGLDVELKQYIPAP